MDKKTEDRIYAEIGGLMLLGMAFMTAGIGAKFGPWAGVLFFGAFIFSLGILKALNLAADKVRGG